MNKIVIKWIATGCMYSHTESLRCTSKKGAEKILNKRVYKNIKSAVYYDANGFQKILIG